MKSVVFFGGGGGGGGGRGRIEEGILEDSVEEGKRESLIPFLSIQKCYVINHNV